MSLKKFHVASWSGENCQKLPKTSKNNFKWTYWPKMTFGCRTPTESINISKLYLRKIINNVTVEQYKQNDTNRMIEIAKIDRYHFRQKIACQMK